MKPLTQDFLGESYFLPPYKGGMQVPQKMCVWETDVNGDPLVSDWFNEVKLGELVGSKPELVKKYRFKRCVQLTAVKSLLDGHLWDNSYRESIKKSIEVQGPTVDVCLLQVFVKGELTLFFIDGWL